MGGVISNEVITVSCIRRSSQQQKKETIEDIFLLTKRASYSLVLTTATSHLSKLTQRFSAEIGPQY